MRIKGDKMILNKPLPGGKQKKDLINKDKLIVIAEKVKSILIKEGKVSTDENFSTPRYSSGC